MTTQPSLLIEELAFAYPDGNQALFGVNLRIERGERVAMRKVFRASSTWRFIIRIHIR